jgi:hypothetical protein
VAGLLTAVMAASAVASPPLIDLCVFTMQWFVKGFSSGAIKGQAAASRPSCLARRGTVWYQSPRSPSPRTK